MYGKFVEKSLPLRGMRRVLKRLFSLCAKCIGKACVALERPPLTYAEAAGAPKLPIGRQSMVCMFLDALGIISFFAAIDTGRLSLGRLDVVQAQIICTRVATFIQLYAFNGLLLLHLTMYPNFRL
jgi:hypothetical protein